MAGVLTPELHSAGLELPERAAVIRAALPEDRAEAWRLQREAFQLSGDAPPAHPGTNDELRVLTDGHRLRSCLTLIHASLWIRGARVSMGGVRHVATDPDSQNQGHASALLRDTLRHLREQRVTTSILFPFSFRYYRKFGYELAGNHVQFWCRPNCIPAYAERRHCRPAVEADAASLAEFHARVTGRGACALHRDQPRWRSWLADEHLQVIRCGGDALTGYAVATETRDAYGGRILRVLDLEAADATAWRSILGYLSQTPAESIEWLTRSGDLHASGLMRTPAPLREGFKPRGIATIRPLFQLRVVHLEEALRSRLAQFAPDCFRLSLRITDDLLPENNRPIALCGDGARVRIRAPQPADPVFEADIRVFSQLFCGYMSPSDAVSQELARCSTPDGLEAAERLFPAGEPFLSELDRF